MKRHKLLRIELASPERKLYCLALILTGEQVNKGHNHAATILRNVAEYMDEVDRDSFVAGCLSSAGFGLHDRVDLVGKLGHLELLCDAVFQQFGWPLPEYQACEGYLPVAAAQRYARQHKSVPEVEITAEGNIKSEWR